MQSVNNDLIILLFSDDTNESEEEKKNRRNVQHFVNRMISAGEHQENPNQTDTQCQIAGASSGMSIQGYLNHSHMYLIKGIFFHRKNIISSNIVFSTDLIQPLI